MLEGLMNRRPDDRDILISALALYGSRRWSLSIMVNESRAVSRAVSTSTGVFNPHLLTDVRI